MRLKKHFPKSLRITKKVDYAVKFKRGMSSKEGYLGLCFFDLKEILLSEGQDKVERLSTLVHEVLHALAHEYGFDLSHDIIYKLERPIALFILLNYQVPNKFGDPKE